MKLLLCLALCAFATALPSADVDPAAVVPESAPDAPDMDLVETSMEASYNDAQATITNLMQQGKNDSACRDMAKATADEVKVAVDSQQKALAGMPNGDDCDDEGQGLIDKANKDQLDADKAKGDAQTALTAATKEKFNFGDFAYDDLQEGQCGTFFNSQTWKNAKSKVNAAKNTYNTKAAEATAAAKAVEAAKAEAKDLVKKCKCNAKQALDTALKNMNDSAKDANQKAWNKSYHMQCVLDGKTTKNCNVPSLPVVTAVPYGKGVEDACARCTPEDVYHARKGCGAPGNMDSYIGGPPPSRLFGLNAGKWGTGKQGATIKSVIWECGDGGQSYPKQQFMLNKYYIGGQMPKVNQFKVCNTEAGWRPLCDYAGGCNRGAPKDLGALFPDKCTGHVHNNQMFNSMKHPGGSMSSAWQNVGYSDWVNSLQRISVMRPDHVGSIETYPVSSWTTPNEPNTIMCILPLNGCKKGECGFR